MLLNREHTDGGGRVGAPHQRPLELTTQKPEVGLVFNVTALVRVEELFRQRVEPLARDTAVIQRIFAKELDLQLPLELLRPVFVCLFVVERKK